MANDPSTATHSGGNATFRSLFRLREYRAVYLATLINWLGDYLSRAAVTVLVYHKSQSVLLSAASFAVGFLPWIVGPLLSAIAERYPYRRVMIVADLTRMALIALLLVPHMPVPLMLLVLLLAGLAAPPAQAARSALLPELVGRERLPLATALQQTASQTAQVVGYLAGATLAVALTPRIALGLDVLTFLFSALLVAFGVRPRPATNPDGGRTHLLRETGEGFRLVFSHPLLRSIVTVVLTVTIFAIVPEGLAAAWAVEGTPSHSASNVDQGLIMAAGPFGFVLGGILFSRLVPAQRRARLVPYLAVSMPLLLVPSIFAPPAPFVAALVMLSGLTQGALLPTLNANFTLALPDGYRARAFGVVGSGVQVTQFTAVIVTGLLADHFRLPLVVGLWSIGGAVVMLLIVLSWPRQGLPEPAAGAGRMER
ncbi:MFS transporter [Actinoplanes lobatus]|uniref:MFS family permease n=1 Tax=Actinoplanes lobatus TaxID=113568 RepID=A0A7W7HEA1_9ACTN|nr:MFS transporter [Actinoplanes lobatus]MBB4748958.1 MFS family permease [Actinoplanes lobatus]GGN68267.1 MFS transporter [Actinoplanes lobatus]GIE37135.1 MFS transporter [Actinoplanes lobatus]